MTLQIRLQKVELKSPEFDLKRGLAEIKMFDWMPKFAIDANELIDSVKTNIPADGVEIVEWMQYCTADNAIIEAYEEEYGKHSEVRGASGDGYSPGVYVAGLRCRGNYGRTVRARGYAIVDTPRGSFRVPAGGKATYANKDILAFAAIPHVWSEQIRAILMRWLNLAKAPITKRVRFCSFSGLTAPNFFLISTRIPSPVCLMRIGLTSNKAQTIQIRGRGTKGNYHNILFEDSFKIDKGESETIYYVTGFPVVGQFTLELQPEDNTKTVLDYLEVYP